MIIEENDYGENILGEGNPQYLFLLFLTSNYYLVVFLSLEYALLISFNKFLSLQYPWWSDAAGDDRWKPINWARTLSPEKGL